MRGLPQPGQGPGWEKTVKQSRQSLRGGLSGVSPVSGMVEGPDIISCPKGVPSGPASNPF